MRVVFCTPTITRPYDAYLASMEAMVPALDAAGITHSATFEIGNPYISGARSKLLRRALDTKPDAVVFIDHDMEWLPNDMLKLLRTEGEVVAGTYRFADDEERYMGELQPGEDGRPIVRDDGCVLASMIPAGFLKVTATGISRFMRAYPELGYGDPLCPHLDLFNHGALDGVWYGEDYAFSKRWRDKCGQIWVVPDLSLNHHRPDKAYPGNFHRFLMKQPGGALHVD